MVFALINTSEVLFTIIDIQEKLVNMLEDNTVKENAVKLCRAAGLLNIPAVITEQYPKGLGQTVEEIKSALSSACYIEKTSFSAYKESAFKEALKSVSRKQIVIFGIETHICVLQTVFELLKADYEVFVVENASGSRHIEDKKSALERMKQAGAQIVTTEQVIFELLESSKHPRFKEVQNIIK